MHDLSQLWLPILLTAVFVFIASSLIHMVFKWHNSDYKKLNNEDEVGAAIRAGNHAPGQYVLPHCMDMKEMQNEAMIRKYNEGPIGFITLRKNGVPGMGQALMLWFVFTLLIAAAAALITLTSVGLQAHPHLAAHSVGTISLLAYCGGSIQQGIWMGRPWGSVMKDLLDGLIYASISAFTFMYFWP
ncbi:MAG: hypothetical protein ACREPB_02720 [Arenimonas sp.]